MIEELKDELYLYNLLRQVFLKEPTRELIEDLSEVDTPDETDDDIEAGLKLIIMSCKNNTERINSWLEDLAIEYARLFIGPKNPPAVPFGSFYLSESRSLMTDETVDVRKKYLEAGMAVKNLYTIPDDHIGIELEFVFYLTQMSLENFENSRREEASRFFELREDFMNNHMRHWVPFFADKIIEHTREDFYRGAAFILKGLF
jgi:TorA maturation chaperone TorD